VPAWAAEGSCSCRLKETSMHGIEAFSGRLGVPPTDENERGRQDVGSVQRCREHG
jgi:hypothetical protein